MAKRNVENVDWNELEKEVERELGYGVENPVWYTAVTWGLVATGVLKLSDFFETFFGGNVDHWQESPPHYVITIAVIAAARYIYEYRRHKKWFARFDARKQSRLNF